MLNDPGIMNECSVSLNLLQNRCTISGKSVYLEPEEASLLKLLMSSPSKSASYERAYRAVWSASMQKQPARRARLRGLARKLNQKIGPVIGIVPGCGFSLKSAEGKAQTVLEVDGIRLDTELRFCWVDEKPVKISPRNLRILELLMMNQGKVLSAGKITESVGCAGEISAMIAQLRNVLGQTAIRTVKGKGYFMGRPNRSEMTKYGHLLIARELGLCIEDEREVWLSPDECGVLCFLMDRPGELRPSNEIVEGVWGTGYSENARSKALRIAVYGLQSKLDSVEIGMEHGRGYAAKVQG